MNEASLPAGARFSTRHLSPAERAPVLHDYFGHHIGLEIDAPPHQAIDMAVQDIDGLRRTRMVSALTARLTRTPSMMADGKDAVCLIINTGGRMSLTQRQQESVTGPGDAVMLLYREMAALRLEQLTYMAVRMPFAMLSRLTPDAQAFAARGIPKTNGALSLLSSYLLVLPEDLSDPRMSQLAAIHVGDLFALAAGSTAEGQHVARQRGVRAARLRVMKAELSENPALDLHQLARRQGVSPRYIQMLFEESGTTLTQFVLERRLLAARAMLANPNFTDWSITAIALEAGFGDLSYFNRCFRQRFLMTPREMRAQSRQPS